MSALFGINENLEIIMITFRLSQIQILVFPKYHRMVCCKISGKDMIHADDQTID